MRIVSTCLFKWFLGVILLGTLACATFLIALATIGSYMATNMYKTIMSFQEQLMGVEFNLKNISKCICVSLYII